MTITTMEGLVAVPEGGTIRVRSRHNIDNVWTRTPDGFTRDGTLLRAEMFTGYMAAGSVELWENRGPIPGDILTDRRYCYVLTHMVGEQVSALTFYNGQVRGGPTLYDLDRLDPRVNTNLTRREELPENVTQYRDSVLFLARCYRDAVSYVLAQPTTEPSDDTPEAPPTEVVVVTVTVDGWSRLEEAVARAGAGLPRNAEMEEAPQVHWSYAYRYPVEVKAGTCACHTLDMAKVEAGLPPRATTWDASASCVYDSPA